MCSPVCLIFKLSADEVGQETNELQITPTQKKVEATLKRASHQHKNVKAILKEGVYTVTTLWVVACHHAH